MSGVLRALLICTATLTVVAACAEDTASDIAADRDTTTTDGGGTGTTTTVASSTTAPPPQEPPTQAELDRVAVRLEQVGLMEHPIALLSRPGDDGLYVGERNGRVRILRDGEIDPRWVLDITSEVSTAGEGGFLGLAFSPDGDQLYVSYTDRASDSRVAAYTMDGNVADPASRRDLLQVDQPAILHNGGHIAVDAEGLLWIGLGDGGVRTPEGRAVAQAPDSLLGKLLRIDPRPGPDGAYGIPPGNPLAGTPGARPEIWALGLRNPWRWSFDPATGDLWIGDVGEFAVEEIDLVAATGESPPGAGANFGWPVLEGDRVKDGGPTPEAYVPPLLTWAHEPGRCAVVAGHVYRGDAIPGLRGTFVYSDLCDGRVRALSQRGGAVIAQRDLTGPLTEMASFGRDAAGELYALSLGGGVFRLVPG